MLPEDANRVRAEICAFIRENLLAEGVIIEPDTILSNIGIDSYSIIEIILFIERKYGTVIPESMLIPENFKSVNAIADCANRIEADTKRSLH